MNILLLQNEKVFHKRLFYGGSGILFYIFGAFLPTKWFFCNFYFVSYVYHSASECQSAHCEGPVEAGKGREQSGTLSYLFVLVSTLPLLFIYKLEDSPFRPVIKVGWVRSNWQSNSLLFCLVTCAVLRNTPEMNIL